MTDQDHSVDLTSPEPPQRRSTPALRLSADSP